MFASSVFLLLKYHYPLPSISSPVLEYKPVSNLGGMPSDWAELQWGGAVVGSCGVVGLHVAFVASAAKVFLARHLGSSTRVEVASEVWLLDRVVKGIFLLSNT